MHGIGGLEKAPGDGACLWHACAIAGADEGCWVPSDSFMLKKDLLDYVRSQPSQVASLLNASCAAAESILQDWGPQDAWADGRAPPLLAAHTGATIVIVNAAEQCLEIFTCAHSMETMGKIWVLHYEHDHFDSIRVRDMVRLRQILQACKLEPLLVNEPSLKPTLKGGASYVGPLAQPTLQLHGKAMTEWIGVPDVAYIHDQGMCHCYNVGGLMSHAQDILGSLPNSLQVVALQETLVTANNQKMLSREAAESGWDIYWSPPAPFKRNTRGAWRLNREVPGLAFWHTKDISLHPAEFRSKDAQKWFQKGRMLLACLPGPDEPTYLLNVYAPAGSRKTQEWREYMEDLTAEIAHWQNDRLVVLGDFQAEIAESEYFLRLAVQGWRAPFLLDAHGAHNPPTYRCGKASSVIDGILLSPDCDYNVQHVLVTQQHTTPHAILSIPIDVMRCEAHPQVCYPPHLKAGKSIGEFDWKATSERLEQAYDALASQTGDWMSIQADIDHMWQEFEVSMREHLRLSGVHTTDQEGHDTQQLHKCGDASPHWRTHVRHKHKTRAAKLVHQAVAWLVSHANQEGGSKPVRQIDEESRCH